LPFNAAYQSLSAMRASPLSRSRILSGLGDGNATGLPFALVERVASNEIA
jgi:hypothetical protein